LADHWRGSRYAVAGSGDIFGRSCDSGFLVLLYESIWFFSPHRETIMLPYAKHAAPVSVSGRSGKSDVILVAGGCGGGFHRGPYGYCVPNGPVVAPPVVVAPRVCPPGYYLGPHGRRCWPVGASGPPPGYGPPPPGYGAPPPDYGPPPPGDGSPTGYGPPSRQSRTPPAEPEFSSTRLTAART
jgi:hypothetical protein